MHFLSVKTEFLAFSLFCETLGASEVEFCILSFGLSFQGCNHDDHVFPGLVNVFFFVLKDAIAITFSVSLSLSLYSLEL